MQTSLNENPLTDCMLCCRFAKRKTNADSHERGLACLPHLGQLTSKKSAALSSRDLLQADGIVAISPWCRMLLHFGFIRQLKHSSASATVSGGLIAFPGAEDHHPRLPNWMTGFRFGWRRLQVRACLPLHAIAQKPAARGPETARPQGVYD